MGVISGSECRNILVPAQMCRKFISPAFIELFKHLKGKIGQLETQKLSHDRLNLSGMMQTGDLRTCQKSDISWHSHFEPYFRYLLKILCLILSIPCRHNPIASILNDFSRLYPGALYVYIIGRLCVAIRLNQIHF